MRRYPRPQNCHAAAESPCHRSDENLANDGHHPLYLRPSLGVSAADPPLPISCGRGGDKNGSGIVVDSCLSLDAVCVSLTATIGPLSETAYPSSFSGAL
mmetsp:Transcript_31736/g.94978  ORF Transcript_31736/g.94978 Transcript_31736/m.94978 type:complete len:99 (-) Transcript_31736:1517-1813(-)